MGEFLEALQSRGSPTGPLLRAIESRCHTVPIADHVVLTRVLGELLLYVDPRDLVVAPHLLMTGHWQFAVTRALARHVLPGMHCLDVGANVGYYTMLLAALVGPTGHVEAFDLQPECVRWLRRSAEVNGFGHVEVQHRAVVGPASDPSVAVVLPTARDGAGRLAEACLQRAAGRRAIADGDEGLPGRAAGTTLDEWIPEGRRVDLVRMAVEGSEPEVWAGSERLRARYNPTVCLRYDGWRPGYPEFLARIRAEGYQVRAVAPSSQLVRLPADPDPAQACTLWLTRK